jgi:hypothetical protein
MGLTLQFTQSAHYSPLGPIGQPEAKPLELLENFFQKRLAKGKGHP